MTAAPASNVENPAAQVRDTDVVVVGGGVAGLVSALECAKIGLQVVVLEEREIAGGCVGRIEVDGLMLDSGAESFATRGGAVAELIESLGLADEVVDTAARGAWLAWNAGGKLDLAPLPRSGVLGIPSNPLGDDVRRIIGWRGALRAYLDRIRPILKVGPAHSLGKLVRARMGARVLDRLVTPISSGVYGADPYDLELDRVAPGLNAAMTRLGSLSGGVGELVETRPAGAAVRGIDGGMHRLVDALLAELERFGAIVVTGTRATDLARWGDAPDERWVVRALAESDDESTPDPVEWHARFIVLAAPAATSLALMASVQSDDAAPLTAWPAAASAELVTLVLDAPELAVAPRGTGALVAAGAPGLTAKALTHTSAKWPWFSDANRAVVRLSYGRAGEPSPLHGLSDAQVETTALADAEALLGIDLGPDRVRGIARVVWRDALSHASRGQQNRVQEVEAAANELEGLEVTGAWVAGTGLASVVPHAHEAAARIRHLAVTPNP